MLHPVGPLPAAVYWRRRLVVLALVAALVGGLVWLAVALLDRRGTAGGEAAAQTTAGPTELPALDRVVPSVAAVRTPAAPSVPVAAPSAPPAPSQVAGEPCTDEVLAIEVRTPGAVPVGSKPTFELLLANTADVPCVRALDKELQELVLVDAAGARVWGSNDCFPESSDDPRTLAPGELVAIPVVWGGLTSEPTCTAERTTPPPGAYAVRGRLDTKVSADAPLTLQ